MICIPYNVCRFHDKYVRGSNHESYLLETKMESFQEKRSECSECNNLLFSRSLMRLSGGVE